MRITGNHPHLLNQNLHSMGSISYLKCKKDSMDFMSLLLTTKSNKVGVVSSYAHLITSGDELINQSVNMY